MAVSSLKMTSRLDLLKKLLQLKTASVRLLFAGIIVTDPFEQASRIDLILVLEAAVSLDLEQRERILDDLYESSLASGAVAVVDEHS